MNGILVVNKNIGNTSRDIVNIVSKILGTKKIGHTGTLDPLASGVLVLCIGKALKICELLSKEDKEYIAGITLGMETDTLDMEGNVTRKEKVSLKEEVIYEVVNSFKGSYMQEVPKYSAVKVKGKKLYEYAREKIDVELPKRRVEIKDIEIVDKIKSIDGMMEFTIKCIVSKGTYIRSLVRDIGKKLNVPSVMKSLVRTRQGSFSIKQAYTTEDIEKGHYEIIDICDGISNIPRVKVTEEVSVKIKNGVTLEQFFKGEMAFILDMKDNLLAIYKNEEGKAKAYRVFNNK